MASRVSVDVKMIPLVNRADEVVGVVPFVV
jgi:hypothetical protein